MGKPNLLAAIPNGLSLGRLLLGLAFPWLPISWRPGVVILAAISDLFDGASSRYFNATSTLGRILDPVADKVFVAALVVTLILEGTLTLTAALLIGLRDLTVLAWVIWLSARGRWTEMALMSPTYLGKVATAAQFVYLLTLLIFAEKSFPVFVVTAVLSGLAAVDYVRVYGRE